MENPDNPSRILILSGILIENPDNLNVWSPPGLTVQDRTLLQPAVLGVDEGEGAHSRVWLQSSVASCTAVRCGGVRGQPEPHDPAAVTTASAHSSD